MHQRLTTIYNHISDMHRLGYNSNRFSISKGDHLLLCLIQVHHLAQKDSSLIGKTFRHEQVLRHPLGVQMPVVLLYSVEPHPMHLMLHCIDISWNGFTRQFSTEPEIPPALDLMNKMIEMQLPGQLKVVEPLDLLALF